MRPLACVDFSFLYDHPIPAEIASGLWPSQAEPGQAFMSRARPSLAEPAFHKQNQARLSGAEPGLHEQSQDFMSRRMPGFQEQSQAPHKQARPSLAEPGFHEQSQAITSRASLPRAEPSQDFTSIVRPALVGPGLHEQKNARLSGAEPGTSRAGQAFTSRLGQAVTSWQLRCANSFQMALLLHIVKAWWKESCALTFPWNAVQAARQSGAKLLAAVVGLHSCGFAIGYAASRMLGLSEKISRTNSIEVRKRAVR
eukprot:764907-Pelagomonas_calceolata.AAC.1